MQRQVLDAEPSDGLRAYIVWVPQNRSREDQVPNATTVAFDTRTEHFWDPGGVLGKRLRAQLRLDEDAWDIYLLYRPDARWDDGKLPEPAWWMHQLGSREKPRVNGPWFDPQGFARRTRDLLLGRVITFPGS